LGADFFRATPPWDLKEAMTSPAAFARMPRPVPSDEGWINEQRTAGLFSSFALYHKEWLIIKLIQTETRYLFFITYKKPHFPVSFLLKTI
jgi:hypothetical protein